MKRVPLSKGLFALVDDEDYERVMEHKWYASFEGRDGLKVYAVRAAKKHEHGYRPGKKTKIRMHRWILDMPPGSLHCDIVVDHVGLECRPADIVNSLDNRQKNLEKITQEENVRRGGGFYGKGKTSSEEPCL
jgi:hypothetical protein